jgi:hypothetical protein
LTTSRSQYFTQDSKGIPDKNQLADLSGYSLAAGDFRGDGTDDLAVGAPGETFGTGAGTHELGGAVFIVYSTASGLAGAGSTFWHQNIVGIANVIETNDTFGIAMASGNYGKTGADDLAIGTQETLNDGAIDPITTAGAIHVLYGTGTGIKAAGAQFLTQNCGGCPDSAEDGDAFGTVLG